jgi:Indigoidine synthase A like protein
VCIEGVNTVSKTFITHAYSHELLAMDISADLTELGRSSVAVLAGGVKSILDIGRTLEYLVKRFRTFWVEANSIDRRPKACQSYLMALQGIFLRFSVPNPAFRCEKCQKFQSHGRRPNEQSPYQVSNPSEAAQIICELQDTRIKSLSSLNS